MMCMTEFFFILVPKIIHSRKQNPVTLHCHRGSQGSLNQQPYARSTASTEQTVPSDKLIVLCVREYTSKEQAASLHGHASKTEGFSSSLPQLSPQQEVSKAVSYFKVTVF